MKKTTVCMIMAALLLCFASIALAAAKYPAKPITLLTAFNPGGSSDVSHRIIEKFASQYVPQPLVISYKPGGGGEIGWTDLVRGKADGYFIGGVDLPHIILQPLLRAQGQPGYKTEDLNPLCGLVFEPNMVMVRDDSPWKTLQDLFDHAKANPGKVTVATVGKLTGDHLFLMQIEDLTGLKFAQVPYSGSGKTAPALLSGEVDAYFGSSSSFFRMERTRALAIATQGRYELCPDVPTFIESGYKILSAKQRGLATPLKFPKEAQAYLEDKLSQMAANPDYQKAVKDAGLMPVYQNSKDFAATITQEGKDTKALLIKMGIIEE